MKKTFLSILVLFLISFSLHSQESRQKKPGRIGISYSSFWNTQDIRNDWGRYEDYGLYGFYGDEITYINKFYTIGFNYIKPLNSWLEYETGLEYSRKNKSTRIVSPDTYSDYIISKSNTTLMSFPLTLRANFLRFFYINSGILMDLDLGGYHPTRYQSGIGGLWGIAVQYDFNCGFSMYINPYYKRRSIISFSSDEDRLKVDETGIRLGLNYNLNRQK